MEYIFGYYDNGTETVKTKDAVHSDLKGFQIVSRDYDDCTIVDSFYVIKKTASNEDVEGACYDWYTIDKHSRYVDKTKCVKSELEAKADLVDGKVPESQLPDISVDAYNKSETLSDETKTLFGFDVDAVPDDTFAYLGQYAQHWWSVLHGQAQTIYVENKYESWEAYDMLSVTSGGIWNIQVADSVDVDTATGIVALHNPTTYTVNGTSDSDGMKALSSAIRGRYILGASFDKNNIYFIPTGMSVTYAGNVVINNNYNPIYQVNSMLATTPEGETTYVHSSDRNAYPDSGTVGGLTYAYLGVPFNNAVAPVKIVTGSYIGTGTYGANNPNTLTFDSAPHVVLIGRNDFLAILVPGIKAGNLLHGNNNRALTVDCTGRTVKWYVEGTDPTYQLNVQGYQYDYLVILQ